MDRMTQSMITDQTTINLNYGDAALVIKQDSTDPTIYAPIHPNYPKRSPASEGVVAVLALVSLLADSRIMRVAYDNLAKVRDKIQKGK